MAYTTRPLFGGAITASLPTNFADVSEIRQVPDHQEVWLDRDGFTSIVVDILERVQIDDGMSDAQALEYHLRDVVGEEDGEDGGKEEERTKTKVWRVSEAVLGTMPQGTPAYTLLATSPPADKQRGRDKEPDFTAILLTLVRLVEQGTDLLIAVNVPHIPGEYDPAGVDVASGRFGDLLQRAIGYRDEILQTFEIKDWGLFGGEE